MTRSNPFLTPMAHASLPDPSWIKGVYDGGDFDDVVVLVAGGMAIVDPAPLAELRPTSPPVLAGSPHGRTTSSRLCFAPGKPGRPRRT